MIYRTKREALDGRRALEELVEVDHACTR